MVRMDTTPLIETHFNLSDDEGVDLVSPLASPAVCNALYRMINLCIRALSIMD